MSAQSFVLIILFSFRQIVFALRRDLWMEEGGGPGYWL